MTQSSPPRGERAPLLADVNGQRRGSSSSDDATLASSPSGAGEVNDGSGKTGKSLFPPIVRVLLTSFLLSLSFAFTQTSLIYAFRTMTCDEYYKTHNWSGHGDRCSVPAIESSAAKSIATMSAVTTTSTIVNLFVTGYWIKRFGIKAAMFQQTVWAAMRNLTQIYAQTLGGAAGMRIIQVTQLFNIMGGGGGYQLAANAYVAALVRGDRRTIMFGRLTGCFHAGASLGFSLGGIFFEYLGPLAPFQAAFCLLVSCTLFGSVCLPYISPNHNPDAATQTKAVPAGDSKEKKTSFLTPLKTFVPYRREDGMSGRRTWELNLMFLGLGTFFSVLATGYQGTALQLVGTNVFGFKPAESGYMLSGTLMVRAVFLSVIFPRIISAGRRILAARSAASTPTPPAWAEDPDDPSDPIQAPPPESGGGPRTETPAAPTDKAHGSQFDLYFLRWSIFLDAVLTGMVALANKPWHLYIAAAILPLASGTGSACRGVVMDMVEPAVRADALGGIALVEKLAQVSTIGLFGVVFAALSEVGRPTMVFAANAVIALVGTGLLLFVRMPSAGQIALA